MKTSARAIYGIYGAGGCGRGVLPVADTMLQADRNAVDHEVVFIDDGEDRKMINGRRVLGFEEFASEPATERLVAIAVADSTTRESLEARCRENGLGFFNVVATNSVIMDEVQIGEGAILSPFVTLASNVRIGRHFHANLYSCVEHDCRIGNYVTFAPGVRCNGNVVIGDHAYLGAGCIVRQGKPGSPLEIGERAVVGMGAVVTKSVPAGVTVVGNPARQLGADGEPC